MDSAPAPITAPLPQGAVRLLDWGLIQARGDQALEFLNGQLTQDLKPLDASQARLAGYCSAKGRLLASFVVWRPAPDELLLAASADLLPATLKRLSMFVLRARCKLADRSAERPLWGLAGLSAQQMLGDAAPSAVWGRTATELGDTIRLPDAVIDVQVVPRYLLAGALPPPGLSPLAPGAWQWLEVYSGVARMVAATVEQFVPQMVNLDLVGGVSFQKGCYPGQEVVARSQYRGTLKRRAGVLEAEQALHPGQEIFHSDDPGQPAGMVVLAGSRDGHTHAALAELKIAALAGGSLHAGSAQGPLLRTAALPYPIPSEAL
jgi:folate-binding protein YgfZ